MNKSQKIVVCLTLFLMLLMALCPPWKDIVYAPTHPYIAAETFCGYRCIVRPAGPVMGVTNAVSSKEDVHKYRVDFSRLGLGFAAAILAGAIAFIAFRKPKAAV